VDADRLIAGLGSRARRLRGERGLTLKELARRSGLSQRFLVLVEAGRGNLSVRSLAGLAQGLGTVCRPWEAEARGLPVVALLGLRGAGKTSIGRRLARRLHVPFVELDRRIEEAAGLSLAEIFALLRVILAKISAW
jgi:XRE family aerobic/anaerobic benzoate catabolism transcriptional regulator